MAGCSRCGFTPKDPRKIVLDGWDDWKPRCNDVAACLRRQERVIAREAKAERDAELRLFRSGRL